MLLQALDTRQLLVNWRKIAISLIALSAAMRGAYNLNREDRPNPFVAQNPCITFAENERTAHLYLGDSSHFQLLDYPTSISLHTRDCGWIAGGLGGRDATPKHQPRSERICRCIVADGGPKSLNEHSWGRKYIAWLYLSKV